ncbi:MAG: methionyl-tRNA formyltransferase [Acidobacteriota bacterium]
MANGKAGIVFFGTSGICIPFLESLRSVFDIRLIITQPDGYGGRKKKLIEPAVKKYAVGNKIRFVQPDKLNRDIASIISDTDPLISVVISYGKFIPGKVFRVPEFNTVNVHFSLLPELRGAAPYQRAVEKGMETTGISIFEIGKEMDAGDIWSSKEFRILPEDTSESLSQRMGVEGAEFLTETIQKIISGKIKKEPQDHSMATYAKAVSKNEGKINWEESSAEIFNKYRAFFPWPGISFFSGEKKITIKKMKLSIDRKNAPPGTVLSVTKESLKVSCGNNSAIEILSILPQGKKEMTPYIYSLGNSIVGKLS